MDSLGQKSPPIECGRRERVIATAILSCFSIALYAPILFAPPGHAPATMFDDYYSLFRPAACIAKNLMEAGELPLWNPYSFGGMPFLASIQMGALYPPNWLHAVLEPELAFRILLFVHVLLAGLGTWLYCRRRGRTFEASLFAAAAYAVSGRVVLHQYAGHPPIAYSAAWLPILFWLVDRCLEKADLRRVCELAVVLACQFLAGWPMFSWLMAYLIPMYALVMRRATGIAPPQSLQKLSTRLLAAAVLALSLVAVQMLPTWEYMQESHRGGGLDYGWATTSSYPPINLLTFVAPGFFGDLVGLPYWGETSLWESTAFCGVVTVVLALFGLLGRRPDRETLFWAFATVVVMLLAMGRYSLVYEASFGSLPGLRLFRGVGKLTVFVTLGLAVLSSRGFDLFLSSAQPSPLAKRICFCLIAACLLIVGGAAFEKSVAGPAPETWQSFVAWVRSPGVFTLHNIPERERDQFLSQSYYFALGKVMLSAFLVTVVSLALGFRKRFTKTSRLTTLGLLCFELFWFAHPYLQTSESGPYREPAKAVRAALERIGPSAGQTDLFRFCCVSSDETLSNQFASERLLGVGGVEASLLKRYSLFVQTLTGTPPQLQTYLSLPIVHGPIFDLLGVRYYVASSSARQVGDISAHRLIQRGVFSKNGLAYDLYENGNALPRAFVVHSVRTAEFWEAGGLLLPGLVEKGALRGSFVEGTLPFPLEVVSDLEASREQCRVTDSRPSQLRMEVSLQKPGLLVINENAYPGWTATVDGQSVTTLPVNLVMRGVPLPAGDHLVEWTFRPTSFRWGRRISLLALVVTLLVWGQAARRQRHEVVCLEMQSNSERVPSWKETLKRVATVCIGLCHYGGAIATVLLAGGAAYLAIWDSSPVRTDARHPSGVAGLAFGTAAFLAMIMGWLLVRCVGRRKWMFGTLALWILFPLTLLTAEFVTRLFVPAWPAIGLHGVPAHMALKAWAPVAAQDGAVGVNDWGQRDRPRSLKPPQGRRRIAFIGDSFLEEGSTVPLSVRVEQKLSRPDLEVINLGVSASSPDEYFHRLRHVAMPLGIHHCVMFVFAGNDFVEDEQSLTSTCGVAAVYPRGSFLSSVGLLGLNHVLTNRSRPLIQAWFAAGDLRRQEEYRRLVLQETDDETIRNHLLDSTDLDPSSRTRLQHRLRGPDIKPFFEVLKAPDAGQFRSYYLGQGLWSAAHGQSQWDPNNEDAALEWVRRSAALCQSRNVDFTLVVIPEAFQVDSRMVEQWRPLTDMRYLTRPCREAAERLRKRASSEGVTVIDLHDVLQEIPGTYLNLDGHWSDKGIELVSDSIAKWLNGKAE